MINANTAAARTPRCVLFIVPPSSRRAACQDAGRIGDTRLRRVSELERDRSAGARVEIARETDVRTARRQCTSGRAVEAVQWRSAAQIVERQRERPADDGIGNVLERNRLHEAPGLQVIPVA